MTPTARRIVAHLARHGARDEVELVADLRLPPPTVATSVGALAAEGAIERARHLETVSPVWQAVHGRSAR